MGESVGRYRIDAEIGRGAMGVVYSAHDSVLERIVALKELNPPPNTTEDIRADLVARFLREARAAARLQHPNVVQVFDVFSEQDRHFIAMELLEGVALSDLLEAGPLQPSAAMQVLLQALDAVGAAHAAGIVHRDLKPENIHVLEDGRIKITDFGIAKITDAPSATFATQMGTIIGTPGYMSPEQVQGLAVDARSDIFALGVIGFELYAGRNPFLANSPTATLYRIVNEPPILQAGVPAEVLGVLMRAVEKHPAQRYASAVDMANDLRSGTVSAAHLGSGASLLAAEPAPVPRRANSTVIAAGAVVALIAAGLLLLALSMGPMSTGSSSTNAPQMDQGQVTVPAREPDDSGFAAGQEPLPEQDDGDSGLPPGHPDIGGTAPVPAVPFWGAFVAAEPDRQVAEAHAGRVLAAGYPALVLDTAQYSTIGKPGQSIWVVCAGPYSTKAEADSVASQLGSAGYTGAYSKQVDY